MRSWKGWLAVWGLVGWALATSYQVKGEVIYQARAPVGAFSGSNPTLEGQVVLEGTSLRGQVCLRLEAWDSKEPLRDRHTREMFQVDQYPQACLRITGYDSEKGLVLGTLSLHGVERPVAWSLRYTLEEGGKQARFEGEFELLLSQYNLKAPSFMGMRVQDRVTVRIRGQGVAR